MSLCNICGRMLCDHTPEERSQIFEVMMRPLSPEEQEAWKKEFDESSRKIEIAKKRRPI